MSGAKAKTYRALSRGESPVGIWHEPGDIFTTDAPKGKWMEEVSAKEATKADEAN